MVQWCGRPNRPGTERPSSIVLPPDPLAILDDLEVGQAVVIGGREPGKPRDWYGQAPTVAQIDEKPITVDLDSGC